MSGGQKVGGSSGEILPRLMRVDQVVDNTGHSLYERGMIFGLVLGSAIQLASRRVENIVKYLSN